MVAGFVELSGGTFAIDSAPGKGTEIRMVLPALKAKRTNGVSPEPDEDAHIRIGSVLVVDDDEGVREIVSEQLRDLGLKVTVAVDAEHALALLERKRKLPEFVLTDFTMPGLDGMELLAAVRERWPGIKGAIMTGNPQERLERRLADVPIVHKPLDLPDLKRLLAGV
jgi:CheY-like chemotaxis protein